MRLSRSSLGAALALLALSACTVGPDYHKPSAPVPVRYKEAAAAAGWAVAQPSEAAARGAWWRVYNDPVLDGLERRIDISNQNLKAAEAAYRQAEWMVAQARAGFFPTGTLNASAQRSRGSGGSSSASGTGGGGTGKIVDFFSVSAAASWTPDIWGQIRRTVESQVANAQASAGDLANARLSAQGQLAVDYLQLRIADELKRLLDASAVAFAESLRIAKNQYAAGVASQSDVSQAQAQLEATQAQAIAVGVTRAQFEHAIAVLIGLPPAALSIAPTDVVTAVPTVPAGMPSALLERRPDIAAAERIMAAANAQIGVAEAAFFPTVTLSADAGEAAISLAKLLSASGRFWSFGGNLVETVFDAGARNAAVQEARAVYEQDVADYRQTVLAAFQQVEDQLAALRILAQQAAAQEAAVAAAREAERVINNQYLAGTVAYTNVIVAEQTALNDAETALNIRQSRLVASAALIQALGGGWDVEDLPNRGQIDTDAPLNFNPLPPPDAFGGNWWRPASR